MARRYYSSTAVATTLSSSASNSDTSITVTALSGYPVSTPWTAIIDPDTASEEVVEVTNVSGTTLTVTRGVDGTSGTSHSAGAVFRHGVSARDFDEPNDHINSSSDVHTQYVTKALVNAKGDLITATANDTPAILTAGSNGQMLMADSSATAGLRYVDPPANRNLLINGAMQVHQRGTSVTGITASGYRTADRWNTNVSGGTAAWTQSVENDAPTGSGLRKSLKMLCTTANASPAAGDAIRIAYSAEGQDVQRIKKGTSDAEQLTATFWVKSNVTGTYVLELFDIDNTRHVGATYTIGASDTWEKKTITFPADTGGSTLDNDNAQSFLAQFWLYTGTNFSSGTLQTTWGSLNQANRAVGQTNLAAATNNYWQITGVQLETGPVATPFEFEPYEATLRKCQRYFEVLAPANNTAFAMGMCTSTSAASGVLRYLPKRAAASISSVATILIKNNNGSAGTASITITAADVDACRINGSGVSNLVAGDATYFQTSAAGGYFISAEL